MENYTKHIRFASFLSNKITKIAIMDTLDINMDFKHWKRVREIIDVNKSVKNKMFLRKHCLANKDLFDYEQVTFQNKVNRDDFSNVQEKYIWKYLVENHPDKVKQVLDEIEEEKTNKPSGDDKDR